MSRELGILLLLSPVAFVLADTLWLRWRVRSAPPPPQSLDEFQRRVDTLNYRWTCDMLVTIVLWTIAFAIIFTDARVAFARTHPWWTEKAQIVTMVICLFGGALYPLGRSGRHAIRLGLVCPHCRDLSVGGQDDFLTWHALEHGKCGRCKRKLFRMPHN